LKKKGVDAKFSWGRWAIVFIKSTAALTATLGQTWQSTRVQVYHLVHTELVFENLSSFTHVSSWRTKCRNSPPFQISFSVRLASDRNDDVRHACSNK
jgi:hypothetical protein